MRDEFRNLGEYPVGGWCFEEIIFLEAELFRRKVLFYVGVLCSVGWLEVRDKRRVKQRLSLRFTTFRFREHTCR